MHKKHQLLNLVLGLSILSSGFAMYGPDAYNDNVGKFYGRIDLGYNIYNAPAATALASLDTASVLASALNEQVSNQVGVNAGLGYKLSPSWRSDFTLTYRPSIHLQLDNQALNQGQGKLGNYTAMVNGYYDFNINTPFDLYFMSGLGVSSNTTKKLIWFVDADDGAVEKGTTLSHFTWQIGAGLSYDINMNLILDFNYQLVDLATLASSHEYNFGLAAPTSWGSLFSNQLQLGVRTYI